MSGAGDEPFARWDRAAVGWGRRAAKLQGFAMPISSWMIEQLALQPGQQVLELAAGPGETGLLAAELIRPGGMLICSDASEAMLKIARTRAAELSIDNVEFRRLELEWIDLPTASIDAILCRWGMMLSTDPVASLQEARRVLRPGGRIALAVWAQAERNPWATISSGALVKLGHAERPEPGTPGMFALAPAARLQETLELAGFVEVVTHSIEIERVYDGVAAYFEETLDLSPTFGEVLGRLSEAERSALIDEIAARAAEFQSDDGTLRLPGRSLVAAASA